MVQTIEELAPRVLPAGWHGPFPHPLLPDCAYRYESRLHDTSAALSLDDYGEHGLWLHLSCIRISRPNKPIPWDLLSQARDLFMGPDRVAIQLLPARKDWMNIHPGCLHLFSRLDAETIPPIWSQ